MDPGETGTDIASRGFNTYTDEELLEALRRLAEELDREPRIQDVEQTDHLPSPQTFVKRFGSWTAAKHEAGLPTEEPHKSVYSDEELLELLRSLAAEVGRSPKIRDLKAAEGYPDRQTYRRRFGSWNEAKRKAGV